MTFLFVDSERMFERQVRRIDGSRSVLVSGRAGGASRGDQPHQSTLDAHRSAAESHH
jgi:hypothetical protein